MKKINWIATTVAAAALLVSVTGCGNGSSSTMGSNSIAASTGMASQGGHRRGFFQPTFEMKVNPTTPNAGKPFTVTFTMQRPNHTGSRQGNGGRNWSGNNGSGGNAGGNWTGGQGGGNWGGNVPQPTAQITGNSINQTITLTNQNRVFEGSVTIQKPGTYQVNFTISMGPRQIKHQFTLKVGN